MDVEYQMYFVNIGFYFVLLLIWICESSATCRLVFQSFINIQPFQESKENCFAHFCPFVISMIIRRGKCVILEKLIYKNGKLEIVKKDLSNANILALIVYMDIIEKSTNVHSQVLCLRIKWTL